MKRFLPLAAAVIVVGIFLKSSQKEPAKPSSAPTEVVDLPVADLPGEGLPSETREVRESKPVRPSSVASKERGTEPTQPATGSQPRPSCWTASFEITRSLSAAQRESFGERDHLLDLSALHERFPKWSSSRLCVRAEGHALAFEKDSKRRDHVRIRGGSGRIRPDSTLKASYCSEKAIDCAPCVVVREDFDSALFGESAEDQAENEESDITAQLSPEVQRELARLERERAPAAIDHWKTREVGSDCSPSRRVAQRGDRH